LAIVGPSGAGKSSVARLLTGLWQAREGHVRLGGVDLRDLARLGADTPIGYLPQEVVLFEGSIADNIARFAPAPDPVAILAAARAAGIEETILRLPDGYETEAGRGGRALSGGQRQLVGLARALYGDPALLVLDEPDASLDDASAAAVLHAIQSAKNRGAVVIVITHRPGPMGVCDFVLKIRDGSAEVPRRLQPSRLADAS
jgi:ABC-type protease/lipase transport system fused ATPase/permease subunit